MFPLFLVLKFLLKQMTRDICWQWDESAELEVPSLRQIEASDMRARKANREVLVSEEMLESW